MSERRRGGIYCRISLKDPNIPKVEVQEAIGRKLAEAAGDIDVVAVYTDDGIGASHLTQGKKKRDDWIRMLDDIKAGRLDVLLAQAEDRFSRQPLEKEILDDLCADSGVTYLTHQDGSTDPAKASGRLSSGIKALVARYYVGSAAEKQRDSNEAAAMRGEPQRGGVRPFGWQDDKRTLDPDESALVRDAFTDLISGKRTLSRIRTDWNNAGILTTRGGAWDITKVEAVLRRPRNAGLVSYRGKVLPDVSPTWEPLISEDTYRAALAILDSPKRKLTKVHEAKHLCSSLVYCGTCGNRLRSTSNARAKTYRCATHEGVLSDVEGQHVSINTSVLDPIVTDAVLSAVLHGGAEALAGTDAAALNDLHGRLATIRKAETDLLDLVGTGEFNAGEIAAKKRSLAAQAQEVEAEIADIAQRDARAALLADANYWLMDGKKVSISHAAKIRGQVRERFESLSLDQKRALLRGLVKVTVYNGRGPSRVKVRHLVATALNDDE